MSLFYVAISMKGEWKKQDENERIMQKKRMLAKYRICAFYFVHDLCTNTFSNVLSYVLLHCTAPKCLPGIFVNWDNKPFFLFSFLKPVTSSWKLWIFFI